MQLDDRVRIATPEGVALELTLAGAGSRIIATALDSLIQGMLFLVGSGLFSLAVLGGGTNSELVIIAVQSLWLALVFFGYPTAFERFGAGKTPGKSALGIRVVTTGGQPISLTTASLRNLFRIIDLLPAFYVVGLTSILATSLNQRIGDVVAGTMVIRESPPRSDLRYLATIDLPLDTSWDVSALSELEVVAIRRYFERRPELDEATRERLAARLALHIKNRIHITDRPRSDEDFLLRVLAEKLQRGTR